MLALNLTPRQAHTLGSLQRALRLFLLSLLAAALAVMEVSLVLAANCDTSTTPL